MGVAPTPLHHRFFATTSRTSFSPILRILSRRATRLSAAASRRPHAPPQHRFRLKLRADRAPPPDGVSQRRVRVPPRIDTHPGCGAGITASGATARRCVARSENALSRCHCTGCTCPRNCWPDSLPYRCRPRSGASHTHSDHVCQHRCLGHATGLRGAGRCGDAARGVQKNLVHEWAA